MQRNRNTDRMNWAFSSDVKDLVWNKGRIVPGLDPKRVRKDACGALIEYPLYGNTNAQRGWEIDHIVPVAKGGGDELKNLQPLQWQNNRSKGDEYPPGNFCVVRS